MRLLVPLRRWDYARRWRARHGTSARGLPVVYLLHIGKTGGTFLKTLLRTPGALTAEPVLFVPFGHNIRHDHLPRGAGFIFATRDPLTRFVSGFRSRLRKGRPATFRDWTRAEAAAFARFATPNALAEALSDDDPAARAAARAAMAGIKHVAQPQVSWFPDRGRLAEDIAAGRVLRLRQEHLATDTAAVLARLGCQLAPGQIEALGRPHANPRSDDSALSPRAETNLRAHYAGDIAFLDWLDTEGLPGG